VYRLEKTIYFYDGFSEMYRYNPDRDAEAVLVYDPDRDANGRVINHKILLYADILLAAVALNGENRILRLAETGNYEEVLLGEGGQPLRYAAATCVNGSRSLALIAGGGEQSNQYILTDGTDAGTHVIGTGTCSSRFGQRIYTTEEQHVLIDTRAAFGDTHELSIYDTDRKQLVPINTRGVDFVGLKYVLYENEEAIFINGNVTGSLLRLDKSSFELSNFA
jgi:hypothetical protein